MSPNEMLQTEHVAQRKGEEVDNKVTKRLFQDVGAETFCDDQVEHQDTNVDHNEMSLNH